MKLKKNLLAITTAAMLMTTVSIPAVSAFACKHEEIYTSVVREAACTETGLREDRCTNCNSLIESHVIEALGHSFGEYVLVTAPSQNENGAEERTCSVCSAKEERKYVCPHEKTVAATFKPATCLETGLEEVVCATCGAVTESRILEKLEHEVTHSRVLIEVTCAEKGLEANICGSCGKAVEERLLDRLSCSYGDWVYTKYATPFEDGERYRQCCVCGNTAYENYSMSMAGSNSIYIPGTNINNNIKIGYFTQSYVDNYDMVYTENAYGCQDSSNPFILGHNTGSLGGLQNTKVGQYIYLSVNGTIEAYKVVVSEYAVEASNGVQMYGQTTGVNIWDTYGSDIPSYYTSYGAAHSGVDRWDADNSKTLHIYTCHANSKAGGRWIVLATLV